ncbi:MAG: hypothetical protein AAF628_34455 [Planctomycetota bacterium]
MNRRLAISISPLAVALALSGAVAAQGADVLPALRHEIVFADGSALQVRHKALSWIGGAGSTPLAEVTVRKSVWVGERLLAAGEHCLVLSRREGAWRLVGLQAEPVEGGWERVSNAWDCELETEPARVPRLEILLATGPANDQGRLRMRFGQLRLELAVAPRQVIETANDVAQVEPSEAVRQARRDVLDVLRAAELYQRLNRREVPWWEALLKPDENGWRYIDLSEPMRDPWGNEYTLGPHEVFEDQVVVRSAGPDGLEGTGDDVRSDALPRSLR